MLATPATLAAVPATQIAQNLAFINWTVLTGLALGHVRGGRPAPPADRRRRAATSASRPPARIGFGVLAWSPTAPCRRRSATRRSCVDPAWDAPRRAALRRSSSLLAALGLVVRRVAAAAGRRRSSWAALAAGGRDAACSGPSPGAAASLGRGRRCSSSSPVVSAATGGVFAAMILGHWYLVTPKLPEAPLILLARVLLAVVALQVVLFVGLDRRPAPDRPTSRRSRRWSGRGRCSSGCA